jgi:hypothetical protein
MTRFAHVVALVLLVVSGCATTAPPPEKKVERVPEEGPIRHRLKLAVLPVESDNYPRLAKGINGVFHDIQVPGVDDYFLSRVTLEVAQLAIECVDVTNECWMAVGKSLTSDRLLLAQITRPGKKKDRTVQLSVTYFDVGSGQPVHAANHTFKTEDEALRGMKDLIDNAVSQTGAATASTEAK